MRILFINERLNTYLEYPVFRNYWQTNWFATAYNRLRIDLT